MELSGPEIQTVPKRTVDCWRTRCATRSAFWNGSRRSGGRALNGY